MADSEQSSVATQPQASPPAGSMAPDATETAFNLSQSQRTSLWCALFPAMSTAAAEYLTSKEIPLAVTTILAGCSGAISGLMITVANDSRWPPDQERFGKVRTFGNGALYTSAALATVSKAVLSILGCEHLFPATLPIVTLLASNGALCHLIPGLGPPALPITLRTVPDLESNDPLPFQAEDVAQGS